MPKVRFLCRNTLYLLPLIVFLNGCDSDKPIVKNNQKVGIITIKKETIESSYQLAGRTVASEISQVRPQVTPFSSFSSVKWQMGPQMLQRFNGLSAVQIQGSAATGESSGGAMDKMQELVDQQQGFNLQWSGLSYQEKLAGGQTIWLYLASIIFIFLCLAALYESWSIPVSVMLVIPLGLIGAVVAASLAGFVNDIYFQVAMLTTIGLSAKNAILIVEFAAAKLEAGQALMEAIIEGAGQRLRPIIMTSLAFVAGVLPLAVSTGAGAVSRKEIGIAVTGGMISGTLLSIFFEPLFFLLVRRLTNKLNEKKMS